MSAVKQFKIVYTFLAIQFILPAISYMVSPATTIATLDKANQLLGGAPYVYTEATGSIWHMLAVGNVMTLGFMCAIMAWDLERFYGMLPGLAFLKAFSALYALGLGFAVHVPMFFGVFVLDGVTTLAIVFFARRAHRELRGGASAPSAPRGVAAAALAD